MRYSVVQIVSRRLTVDSRQSKSSGVESQEVDEGKLKE